MIQQSVHIDVTDHATEHIHGEPQIQAFVQSLCNKFRMEPRGTSCILYEAHPDGSNGYMAIQVLYGAVLTIHVYRHRVSVDISRCPVDPGLLARYCKRYLRGKYARLRRLERD